MDLETFNNNFTTKVVRYEAYPAQDPTCYVVGFSVLHVATSKSMYIDCQVPFESPSLPQDFDSDDVVKAAWESLYESVKDWGVQVMRLNPLLNTVLTPTDI